MCKKPDLIDQFYAARSEIQPIYKLIKCENLLK